MKQTWRFFRIKARLWKNNCVKVEKRIIDNQYVKQPCEFEHCTTVNWNGMLIIMILFYSQSWDFAFVFGLSAVNRVHWDLFRRENTLK